MTALRAQSIHTKDGQTFETLGLRRDGPTILASIKTATGNAGEVGYDIANIAHIDFPEPPQLKLASGLLNAGRADEAARQLTPILAYYTPFRDVPGNWWLPLAYLQVDALARTGRDVDSLIGDISQVAGTNPDTQRWVKIKQAVASERRGEHQKALDALDPLVKDAAAAPDALTEAWLTIGSARLALHSYQDALLAFLHVPVYTPDRALLMAPALLGSADAYVGLEDRQRAQNALKELVAAYPTSPEAALAKDRLQKLITRAPKTGGG